MYTTIRYIIRKISKSWKVTLLNVFGLTSALVCSIFLISWVVHESSYDWFVKEKEKIYRVILEGNLNDEWIRSATCVSGIGPEATKLYPEIEAYARLSDSYKNSLIKSEDNKAFRADGYAADSTFFDFFSYQAVAGDLSKALSLKNNMVIDKKTADKLFGDDNAIDKQLFVNDQAFRVAAVIEEIPSNSHLQFQFLVPVLNMPAWWISEQWGGDNSITYLKINPDSDLEVVSDKITDLVYNHEPFWQDFKVRFLVQHIKDIPFDEGVKFEYAKKTSKWNIYALSGVAFLILLIACINFINLFISSAMKRKRSTGIKLSYGAGKFTLVKEYLAEVVVQVLCSFMMAVILLKQLQPFLTDLSGSVIDIDILSPRFLFICIPVLIMTILLAGFFPGFYLTRFNLVDILKNTIHSAGNRFNLQKSLVITQFSISIILTFAVIVIYKQVNFMQSKDLGFEKENVVYVYTAGKLKESIYQDRLKSELIKNPNIAGVAYRGSLPTVWNNGSPVLLDPEKEEYISTEEIHVDEGYFDLMKIDFIEGENVFKQGHDSLTYCIINEKLAEAVSGNAPVVNELLYTSTGRYGEYYVIKGVVKNTNSKALYQGVDPCIYIKANKGSETGIMLFRLTQDYEAGIATLRAYWSEEFPNQPFEYWFLDQTYDQLYKAESKTKQVLSCFATLAFILTALGLLAMVFFMTQKRTKEIGIRKVNGANVSEVVTTLNKDFVKWVGIAFVIAIPIAYYAMHKWLQSFAYKTNLSWWIFALAGALALGIALLTVSWQTYWAATRNPVEALRYE